jgi:cytochrome c biogenesis protein CcmG/thiol:disulfide interchange protein DsbE
VFIVTRAVVIIIHFVKKFVCFGVVLLLLLAAGFTVYNKVITPPSVEPSALTALTELPMFSLTESMSGRVVTKADVVGRKLLLNVWATWCVACKREHPFFHQLAEQGVRLVGLNYRDARGPVDAWFAQLGNPYEMNLMDVNGELGEQLPVVGAPETYFINSDGGIDYKHSGMIDQASWDAGLAKIYAEMQ